MIPEIGVDTALQPLGLLADGSLEPPSQWQRAGWYSRGIRPGEVGPAVIAGHVDSTGGPAVFYRLRDLHVGNRFTVVESSGPRLVFTVTSTEQFSKAHFPTATVYGPTSLAEVKLVTCTGDFDRAKLSYVDNLVVTAVLDPS